MTEEKREKGPNPELENLMFAKHFQITIRVALITLGGLAIFGGGGYLLDTQFGTKPLFLIIGVVVSYPIIQVALYRTFRSMTKKITDKE